MHGNPDPSLLIAAAGHTIHLSSALHCPRHQFRMQD
jgi:hypothetical protein